MQGHRQTLERILQPNLLADRIVGREEALAGLVPQGLGDRVDQVVRFVADTIQSALKPIDGISASTPG